MEKLTLSERFYDYIDTVAMTLYEAQKTPYLKGVSEALNFLLDQEPFEDLTQSQSKKIEEARFAIEDTEFNKEEVRKAIQIALLKGFKHMKITNAMMTPDTIGMFIAYLLKKLYKNDQINAILDPLVGTGNLLATLNNYYKEGVTAHGIDNDELMSELARNMFDALDMNHQVYLQNTLTYEAGEYDLVVTDFPIRSVKSTDTYLPYQVIVHHVNHLKAGKFFVAVIENDFFEQYQSDVFKETLAETTHLYGLIKLDEGLFKTHPKSILILQKKENNNDKLNDFLLVDLPPFTDVEAFNKSLAKIEDWFKNREVD